MCLLRYGGYLRHTKMFRGDPVGQRGRETCVPLGFRVGVIGAGAEQELHLPFRKERGSEKTSSMPQDTAVDDKKTPGI